MKPPGGSLAPNTQQSMNVEFEAESKLPHQTDPNPQPTGQEVTSNTDGKPQNQAVMLDAQPMSNIDHHITYTYQG